VEILLVDDDADARRALAELLRSAGFGVLEAGDGEQALLVLKARRPALVVTDLRMPVLDGHGLVRRMRGDSELAGIPVLVLSSSTDRELAADRQLTKPCRWREVRSALGALLGRGQRPAPA
jgi:DNA-binding response OmpR family regulator